MMTYVVQVAGRWLTADMTGRVIGVHQFRERNIGALIAGYSAESSTLAAVPHAIEIGHGLGREGQQSLSYPLYSTRKVA